MSVYADVLGMEPTHIAAPESVEEAAEAVSYAAKTNQAVAIWGGGTAQSFGYAPRRADILLETAGLNKILGVEAGDLTISVEAGVTLSAIQNALGEHGLFLPLDAEDAAVATIGGILATNAHGAARTGYGTVRDSLIGLTVADAQGNIVKSGGNVVKNVTGYDLPKIHTGAMGTLGVILSANFKVSPLPEASESLAFRLPLNSDYSAFLAEIRDRTTPIIAVLQTQSDDAILFLVYAGFREAVADDAEKASRVASEHMGAKSHSHSASVSAAFLAPPASPLRVRVTTRPTGSAGLHLWLQSPAVMTTRTFPFIGQTEIFAASDADLHALLAGIPEVAATPDISFAVQHAPLSLRQGDYALWKEPSAGAFALMRRLKETLDPAGTLNPGRFVGTL